MNNSQLSYKQKKYLLIVLLVLLSSLSYKRIIKKTYTSIVNYKNKKHQQSNNNVDISIETIKAKIGSLDKVVGSDEFEESLIQQDILEFISTTSKNIDVVTIRPTHYFDSNGYKIITNIFTIEGSYNSIIKVIFELEKKFNKSKLNSLRFYTKKEYRTKRNKLYAKLFFQNFKKN